MLGMSGTRKWVYAQSVNGRYQQVHRWVGRLLQAWLVITPWVLINGHPAVRLDFPHQRVYAFGTLYGTSEAPFLMLFLFSAVFGLFFITSVLGRVWCGYACPQTVFLEEWVRRIERLVEGDRNQRMKQDGKPMTAGLVARKALKLTLFFALALGIAMSFQSWFAGARELWTGRAGPVDYGMVTFWTGVWFVDFAWFREQLCGFLCPYARFQSAMTDDHSLIVAYDDKRGEPRGRKTAKEEGGCVDCNRCVTVCPAGIDIRDGFQLECIQCARCVDACTDVMAHFNQPTLIRYSSLAKIEGQPKQLIRVRPLVYGTLVSVAGALILTMAARHEPIDAAVNRMPGSMYIRDEDGAIRNTYLVRITDNDPDPVPDTFTITIDLPGAEPIVQPVTVQPTQSQTAPLIVRLPEGRGHGNIPFHVFVSNGTDTERIDATFMAPHDDDVGEHGRSDEHDAHRGEE